MKLKYAILAASLIGAAAANAATITWSSASFAVTGATGSDLSTGVFDQTGTLFLAENLGGAATTFDGINFAAGTTPFNGSFGGFHLNTPLSNDGIFGAGGSASTLTLSGLSIGHTYSVQTLVYDGRGPQSGRTVEFDGIDQGQYANGVAGVTFGAGLLVTGTFTADSATQSFTIEAFDGATSVGGQANALLVHTTAVPEPSSTALLGLGGLTLILRRRK